MGSWIKLSKLEHLILPKSINVSEKRHEIEINGLVHRMFCGLFANRMGN